MLKLKKKRLIILVIYATHMLAFFFLSNFCWMSPYSVVGLNFDFLVLNMTKHSSYLIYNAAMFFSSEIQRQYHEKYGDEVATTAFFVLY
jgi:hypothetical protein